MHFSIRRVTDSERDDIWTHNNIHLPSSHGLMMLQLCTPDFYLATTLYCTNFVSTWHTWAFKCPMKWFSKSSLMCPIYKWWCVQIHAEYKCNVLSSVLSKIIILAHIPKEPLPPQSDDSADQLWCYHGWAIQPEKHLAFWKQFIMPRNVVINESGLASYSMGSPC